MRIETERLILRELTVDDFKPLYDVLTDSKIMQHYSFTFDEEKVMGWITDNLKRYENEGFGHWAIVLKSTGEMIGDCGITMQNINGETKPEIGYHVNRKHQRKGYAKEAAGKCRDWGFENTEFDIIYSYMKKSNVPSYSTAIANGMSKVDEFIDEDNLATVVYAITRDEWKSFEK